MWWWWEGGYCQLKRGRGECVPLSLNQFSPFSPDGLKTDQDDSAPVAKGPGVPTVGSIPGEGGPHRGGVFLEKGGIRPAG